MNPYRDPLASAAQTQAQSAIKKHPYVAKQLVKSNMSDAQRQGIETWNSMIDKLLEAGLMENKG
jgi:hypothetical protein